MLDNIFVTSPISNVCIVFLCFPTYSSYGGSWIKYSKNHQLRIHPLTAGVAYSKNLTFLSDDK